MDLLPELPTATVPVDSEVLLLPLDQVQANPGQMRRRIDQSYLQQLSSSIKSTNGVIQPIIVQPTPPAPDGQLCVIPYEIIAGECRWRGSMMAGLDHIRAIVLTGISADHALALQAIENLQRQNPGLSDTVHYVARLLERFKTPAEVARQISMSDTWVSNMLAMLKLPAEVRQAIEAGGLDSAEMAAELARMVDVAPMHDLTLACLVDASKGDLTRAVLRRRYAQLREHIAEAEAAQNPTLQLDEPEQPQTAAQDPAATQEEQGGGKAAAIPEGTPPTTQFIQSTGAVDFLSPEAADRRYTVVEQGQQAAGSQPVVQVQERTAASQAQAGSSRATDGAKAAATKPVAPTEPEEQVAYVDIGEIHEEICSAYRRYVSPAAQAQLVSWVKENKFIPPLVVRYRAKGGYGLVDGRRLLNAARECGIKRIPVLIRRLTERQALLLSAAINEGHQASTAADDTFLVGQAQRMNALPDLEKLPGWSAERVAARKLLRETAAIDVLTALEQGRIGLGHAELLAHLPAPAQEKLLPRILQGGVIPLADLKEQLLTRSKDLENGTPFDVADCALCTNNSSRQARAFTHHIGYGRCSGLKCWADKEAAAKLETAA